MNLSKYKRYIILNKEIKFLIDDIKMQSILNDDISIEEDLIDLLELYSKRCH